VERWGGRLSYERVADGNRIVLDLPVAGTTLPDPRAPRSEPALILVCDSEDFVRGLLVRMMDRRGHRSIEARSGREAVAAVAAQDVDLVIADGNLPDLKGPELYRALREAGAAHTPQLILVTSDAVDERLAALSAQTGVPITTKPFDQAKLDELIRAALDT